MRLSKRTPKILFWLTVGSFLLLSGSYLFTHQSSRQAPLIINEFLAGNVVGPADEDGDFSDWIEIYNPGNQPLNLSGWSVSDNPEEPEKWTFPEVILRGGDYLVIFASGKDRKEVEAGRAMHTNFKLSRTDHFLGLYNVLDDQFVDVITLDNFAFFRNVSYGRSEGESGYFTTPTPGEANLTHLIRPEDAPPLAPFTERPGGDNQLTADLLDETIIQAIVSSSPLRISEIMYNPEGGSDYEFIELQNVGSEPIDLAGLYFEGIEITFQYGTPPVAPGEFIVIVRNETAFAERYPAVPIGDVYDGNLSNSGELLVLKDLLGNVVALAEYDDEEAWPLSPDGVGDSLVLIDPVGNPTAVKNWQASDQYYGSPGTAEPALGHITINLNPLRWLP